MNGETPPYFQGARIIDSEERNAPARVAATAHAIAVALESMKMERTDWSWEDWIALGEVHLIAGAPEAGKTTAALSLAAIQSSGGVWPDGSRATAANVLIWTGEDNPAKTIKPRLVQMDADAKRVFIVTGKRDERGKVIPFNPATDLPILAAAAKEIKGGVAMLVIDPIVSVIGGKVDNGNNAGHREKLQPLVDFAKDLHCAIIGITHFTKGTAGRDPVERITGSLAFGAIARVAFAATKNREDDHERIFVMIKNNLSTLQGAFGYSIIGGPLKVDPTIMATRLVWGERIEGEPREILSEAEGEEKRGGPSPKQHSAQAWLLAALADGPQKQKDIEAEGAKQSFSSGQIYRASVKLGVLKRSQAFRGGWSWWLP